MIHSSQLNRPIFVFLLWPMDTPLLDISVPFIELCDILIPYYNGEEISRGKESNQELLRDLYHGFNTNSLAEHCLSDVIPSFISMSFEERTHRSGFLLETLLLCPITTVQANCLHSLWARWGFLLTSRKKESLFNDVLMSSYLEMIRIYTHPFLSGCSESLACIREEKWTESFRKASGKVLVMEYVMKCMRQVGCSAFSFRIGLENGVFWSLREVDSMLSVLGEILYVVRI